MSKRGETVVAGGGRTDSGGAIRDTVSPGVRASGAVGARQGIEKI